MIITLYVLLLLLYYIQFDYREKIYPIVYYHTIKDKLKTGDIILFKAYNSFNSISLFSYFTHIGIVVLYDNIPYIFEAANTTGMPLKTTHNLRGIFVEKLEERINRYKGKIVLKYLKHPLTTTQIDDLKQFIEFAKKHMYYQKWVKTSVVANFAGVKLCSLDTNCAELTFLSLIKTNLLPMKCYYKNTLHYMRWIENLKKVNNNEYIGFVEILHDTFHS